MTEAYIIVNNGVPVPGQLVIEQHYETIWSVSATVPDPHWTLIDDAGHFHAYGTDGELPTLRSRMQIIDNEDGEGYTVTEWRCRVCDVLVIPGRVPQMHPRQVPTLHTWSVEVCTERPIRSGMVTVRILEDAAGKFRFGVAVAQIASVVTDEARTTVTTQLHGMSPLVLRMTP